MKDIVESYDEIEEELCDAEKYALKAIRLKEAGSIKADTYYRMAGEEVGHANSIHSLAVQDIDAYRKEHGDAPEPMKLVYDVLHKKYIAHMATVKGLLSLYKGDK